MSFPTLDSVCAGLESIAPRRWSGLTALPARPGRPSRRFRLRLVQSQPVMAVDADKTESRGREAAFTNRRGLGAWRRILAGDGGYARFRAAGGLQSVGGEGIDGIVINDRCRVARGCLPSIRHPSRPDRHDRPLPFELSIELELIALIGISRPWAGETTCWMSR